MNAHAEMILRGRSLLRNNFGCSVIISELVAYTFNGEIPDVIGWTGKNSILLECKATRSDFLADRRKRFRNEGYQGMGRWRFYLVQEGIIKDESDCPPGWGIYEIRGRSIVHIMGQKYANAAKPPFTPCMRSEQALLLSALRRTNIYK